MNISILFWVVYIVGILSFHIYAYIEPTRRALIPSNLIFWILFAILGYKVFPF